MNEVQLWFSFSIPTGGPLVDSQKKEIVGVISWTIPVTNDSVICYQEKSEIQSSLYLQCGQGFPDGYTRVYTFVDWIKKHMETALTE